MLQQDQKRNLQVLLIACPSTINEENAYRKVSVFHVMPACVETIQNHYRIGAAPETIKNCRTSTVYAVYAGVRHRRKALRSLA